MLTNSLPNGTISCSEIVSNSTHIQYNSLMSQSQGAHFRGVRVIVLRRAVSRAREGNTLEADAIELLSLPLAINRVNVQQNRHSWPSVTSRSSEWGGNSIAPVFPQYAHLACLTSVQKDDAHPFRVWYSIRKRVHLVFSTGKLPVCMVES